MNFRAKNQDGMAISIIVKFCSNFGLKIQMIHFWWFPNGSIVDCLPVALPTKYFAHRLLPPSTLPTNILPMSILPMKYFACKVLLMSILPVVFCQSVWSRLYFASGYLACSGQDTGGQSTWWQSTSGNIRWAYYKLAKYDWQNLGRQNTSWAKYWQAKYDFMYLKSYIACCCVAHEVLCPPCVTT